MGWFNYYGLAILVILLIPNIVYALKNKGVKQEENKVLTVFEQISRFACMIFLLFNIPYTYFGFYFESALLCYLIVNVFLLIAYYLGWCVLKKETMQRGLILSLIPSLIFLFSGVMIASAPLIVFAIIFMFCHVKISLQNVKDNKKL